MRIAGPFLNSQSNSQMSAGVFSRRVFVSLRSTWESIRKGTFAMRKALTAILGVATVAGFCMAALQPAEAG